MTFTMCGLMNLQHREFTKLHTVNVAASGGYLATILHVLSCCIEVCSREAMGDLVLKQAQE